MPRIGQVEMSEERASDGVWLYWQTNFWVKLAAPRA